jgi:hypothetical protein
MGGMEAAGLPGAGRRGHHEAAWASRQAHGMAMQQRAR